MSWLSYSNDEVLQFHPEFKSAADEALQLAGLDQDYKWTHHLRNPGSDLIPDFVLQHKRTNRWIAAVEIKRKREAVHSTRNQIQAKGYAEENLDKYLPNKAKYFAISNLEDTILFALNGNRPPRECRLQNGLFESGRFESIQRDIHRQNFIANMLVMLDVFIRQPRPAFDKVWPGILNDFILYSSNLPYSTQINISEPATPNWAVVRDYFASSLSNQSSRMFILRCLMAEYLRGILHRYNHPRARTLLALNKRNAKASTANAIETMRGIDFKALFETSASGIYRNITDPLLLEHLTNYIERITRNESRIVELASSRVDAPELLDSVTTSIYPVKDQDESGKVTTDPELAALLASVCIYEPNVQIVDPCCGDGALLSAAYDRLQDMGQAYSINLAALSGIEADPILSCLASVRLALKQPASVSQQPIISILYGDMFANSGMIASSDVVLMNPPFKRYEAQDQHPVPPELREYYDETIDQIDNESPVTTYGQANLYSYYVEFAAKAARVGTRLGIILDNKWYHNQYSRDLRRFLLEKFQIEAVIEYPHSAFFANWTIATSILVIRKVEAISDDHKVKFVRSKVDPRSVDLHELQRAFRGAGSWPLDWTCRELPQKELKAEKGWKQYFAQELKHDYRLDEWPTLGLLFEGSRRGSLEKEGGGIGVLEFPFHRTEYGPRRKRKEPQVGFKTAKDRDLTAEENEHLAEMAEKIPEDFRGFAVKNSNSLRHYELTLPDVKADETLEPPTLRSNYDLFQSSRSAWSELHDQAITEMKAHQLVGPFISGVEDVINLNENTLPKDRLWNVLREPIAGELIIPRKTRTGHRVHINPFAFDIPERQVRISSNFITYKGCSAVEPDTGLDRRMATNLIAAFLVSSFGQLQFEIEGYNREGLLALEKDQLNRIKIFDPRWIRSQSRQSILDAFSQLPYPISTDRLSTEQERRNELDRLFAEEICNKFNQFEVESLIDEVHLALDEWLIARQP